MERVKSAHPARTCHFTFDRRHPITIMITTILLLILTTQVACDEPVSFSILEEASELSFVGNIAIASALRDQLNSSLLDNLRFSILNQDHDDFFTIDEVSGDLRTTKPIDRDDICPQELSCVLQLEAAVLSSPTYFKVIQVQIEVVDINDETPYFLENPSTRTISENAPLGSTISLPTAEDRDSSQYGIKAYTLATTSDEFALNIDKSVPGSVRLYLVLQQPLDREDRDSYRLGVTVTDGTHSEQLVLDVTVLDHNDHPPLFLADNFMVRVPEDTSSDAVIFTVTASDQDQDANGEIRYSFSTKTQRSYGSVFSIDAITGIIRLDGELDFDVERRRVAELQVVATDRGQQSLRSETTVHVHVTDVNDNPPRTSLTALTSSGTLELSESAPPGSLLAHVSVVDPDTGRGGEVSCSLYPSSVPIAVKTDASYRLVTSSLLDREMVDHYDMVFECTDLGEPRLTSSIKVTLNILDENDNAPSFLQGDFISVLRENNPSDSYVTTAQANDPDAGDNGIVRFKLIGNNSEYFNINSSTGEITASKSFDYEDINSFNVTIIAEDQGEGQLRSTANLLVAILDVNDVAPNFIQNKFTFVIPENQGVVSEVGQVIAEEIEEGIFGEFVFSISDSSPQIRERFSMNPLNGVVSTKMALDREEKSSYDFVVTVSDKMDSSLSATATVSIFVADENDNDPRMRFPVLTNNTLQVSNKMPMGFFVCRVLANDDDAGQNAALIYSIIGGTGRNYFHIDENSGNISTLVALATHDNERFSLRVQVQDGGVYPRSSDSYLTIVVNKTVPFYDSGARSGTMVTGANVTIVIVVSTVSVIAIIVLAVAIILVRRGGRSQKRHQNLQTILVPNPNASSDKQLHQIHDNQCFQESCSNVNNKTSSHLVENGGFTHDPKEGDEVTKQATDNQRNKQDHLGFELAEVDCATSEASSCQSATDSGRWSTEDPDALASRHQQYGGSIQNVLPSYQNPQSSYQHRPSVNDHHNVNPSVPPRPPRMSVRTVSGSSSFSSKCNNLMSKPAVLLPVCRNQLEAGSPTETSDDVFHISNASHV